MNVINKKACKKSRNEQKEENRKGKSSFLIEKRDSSATSHIPTMPTMSTNYTTNTIKSTLLSSSPTINSVSSNIFSGDHPFNKSFLAGMIIAIVIAIIFIGFIIKKLVFYKTKSNKNPLLDSMASSNISESSSSYIISESNFNQALTESNLENNNSLLLIDLEHNNINNISNNSNCDETVSEITNANLSNDIVDYVPKNCISDETSSFDIDLELPSSKTHKQKNHTKTNVKLYDAVNIFISKN
ncbi:hypothetical protein C1645_870301 [Glomus cerebriforme]|uniref:Uncharacterized protein n=1 Tax=Glomus cerebriforme TaxID=658196 RepID=A0A397TRF7_9GLOM|nr:hypothetical protein C1645_870301 [Glomus cerebriforme]